MATKSWEERSPGYHSYFKADDRTIIYGDVRATNIDFEASVVYIGLVYTPAPYGINVGTCATLAAAKELVEQECDRQSL